MTNTTATPTYVVTMPLIQILGDISFSGNRQVRDRHLRLGDVVPAWVPKLEIQRLLAGGFIKEDK